jgi:hypothetical protein
VPPEDLKSSLAAFVSFAQSLKGDEKSEAQSYSLRDLYRTLEQPGDNPLRDAHTRLDAPVRIAYGMPGDVDPLAFLLELNLACAAREKAGEKITPPGLPLPAEEQANFITDDCIWPPQLTA